MAKMTHEEWAAHIARIQAECKAGQIEFRRKYRRDWMREKRRRDRDAKEPSRVVLAIPPDLAAILIRQKPAGLPWPQYLERLVRVAVLHD